MLYRRDHAGGWYVIYEGPCWICYIGGALQVILFRKDPAGRVIQKGPCWLCYIGGTMLIML